VSDVLTGLGLRLRRATLADVDYLVELAKRPEIADFLAAVSPWGEDDLRAALAAAEADPAARGRFVLEVETGSGWAAAGGLGFSADNRRSRIASVHGVMVDPAFRGRGLAVEATRLLVAHLVRDLGYHRVQLEVYGFNEGAQRVFERAGFRREGVRRKAYWRRGAWQDGVLFGLLAEELEPAADPLA
jgi:RimJ/RimL family protein N-acetyltransferase